MNAKPLFAAGLLAMTLVALAPGATAGSGPHVTVVFESDHYVQCLVANHYVPLGEVTLTIDSNCVVTADYHANNYVLQCTPRSTPVTATITVDLEGDCAVVVHVR